MRGVMHLWAGDAYIGATDLKTVRILPHLKAKLAAIKSNLPTLANLEWTLAVPFQSSIDEIRRSKPAPPKKVKEPMPVAQDSPEENQPETSNSNE